MDYNYWAQGQQQAQAWYAAQGYYAYGAMQQPTQAYSSVQMGQSYAGFEQGQMMQPFSDQGAAPQTSPPPPPPPPQGGRGTESPPPPPPPSKKPAMSTDQGYRGHSWRAGVGFQRQPVKARTETYNTSSGATNTQQQQLSDDQGYQYNDMQQSHNQSYSTQQVYDSMQQSYRQQDSSEQGNKQRNPTYNQGTGYPQTSAQKSSENSYNTTNQASKRDTFNKPFPVGNQGQNYGGANSNKPTVRRFTEQPTQPVFSSHVANKQSQGMSVGEQIRVGFAPGPSNNEDGNQRKGPNFRNIKDQYRNLTSSFKSSGTFLVNNKEIGGTPSDPNKEEPKLTARQKWYRQQQEKYGFVKKPNKKPKSQIAKEDRIRRTIKREHTLKSGAAKVRYEYPDGEVVTEEDAKMKQELDKIKEEVLSSIPEEEGMVWPDLPADATLNQRVARVQEQMNVDPKYKNKQGIMFLIPLCWGNGIKCMFQFFQLRPAPKTWVKCEVYIEDIIMAEAEAGSKKTAKFEAFEKASEALKNTPVDEIIEKFPRSKTDETVMDSKVVARGGDRDYYKESNYGNISCWRKANEKWPLSEFVILSHVEQDGHPSQDVSATNPVSVMRQSADFSRMHLEYIITGKYVDMTDEEYSIYTQAKKCGERVRYALKRGMVDLEEAANAPKATEEERAQRPKKRLNVCKLYIEGVLLGESEHEYRQKAKQKAAEIALESFKETNYTILIKPMDLDVSIGVSKAQVFVEGVGPLSEYSEYEGWAARVMRKWGWTGGGLGPRNNPGIEMPVDVLDIWGKEGIGIREQQHDQTTFHSRLQDYLNDFALQAKSETLIFSPEFTKQERADIHHMAHRLSLKAQTVSDKKNGCTYVIVSRKVSGQEILQRLKELGGQSQKYILKPPELAEFMGENV